jgi:hypothetical protein
MFALATKQTTENRRVDEAALNRLSLNAFKDAWSANSLMAQYQKVEYPHEDFLS